MTVIDIYIKSDFVRKYRSICEKYNDFNNRMRGDNILLYKKMFDKLNINYTYNKKESFFKLENFIADYKFNLNLILKGGLVEALIYIETEDDFLKPSGRFDFIAEQIDKEFDRKKYNLPKYCSEQELECIVEELLSLYQDLRTEFRNSA
ncbi:hypothetical protein [Pedobacter endophyticus]|uniref:Uncharacterized protein n=1 Tax=Pedobacter endophyticus TaxID=2789740 RepID=A0A7S9PZA7_9SPHI|nr:hypothetical protein [Pedobacter endophyticus]QPH39442.1 hypothetical protein IZT61_20760 [Pedobacter endophyticus]